MRSLIIGCFLLTSIPALGSNDGFTQQDRQAIADLKTEVRALREALIDSRQAINFTEPASPKFVFSAPEYDNPLDAKLAAYEAKGLRSIMLITQVPGKTTVRLFYRDQSQEAFTTPVDMFEALKPYRGHYENSLVRIITGKTEEEMKRTIIQVLEGPRDIKDAIVKRVITLLPITASTVHTAIGLRDADSNCRFSAKLQSEDGGFKLLAERSICVDKEGGVIENSVDFYAYLGSLPEEDIPAGTPITLISTSKSASQDI